jgi:predicted transposase YbfD/YdcC
MIISVRGRGLRDGRRIDETRYTVTSLRTDADALSRDVRDRWSMENSWHWPRDTKPNEDGHR